MSTSTTEQEITLEEAQTRPKRQPSYAVILHNDPVNGFEFVVQAICKVFGYSRSKAFLLTYEANATGRSIVWTGSLEVAELKADQICSCGPDPDQKGAGALGVSIEPLPEG